MIIFQNIIWSAEKALFLADFLCHPICCDGFDDVTITSYLVKSTWSIFAKEKSNENRNSRKNQPMKLLYWGLSYTSLVQCGIILQHLLR